MVQRLARRWYDPVTRYTAAAFHKARQGGA
jgi:hypothetical protein